MTTDAIAGVGSRMVTRWTKQIGVALIMIIAMEGLCLIIGWVQDVRHTQLSMKWIVTEEGDQPNAKEEAQVPGELFVNVIEPWQYVFPVQEL